MIVNPPFDTAAATDFPARRYGNRASSVVEIGHGEWVTVCGFMLDGGACVARFGAQSDDFAKEAIAASYAASAGSGHLAWAVSPIDELT